MYANIKNILELTYEIPNRVDADIFVRYSKLGQTIMKTN